MQQVSIEIGNRIHPDNQNYCKLGDTLLRQGNFDAAIENYRKALALGLNYAEAHCGMGYALQSQGKLDAAIECYRRAISFKPSFAGAHSNLGLALQTQGNLDAAVESFRKAVAFNPDFSDAHFNLGIAFKQQGNLNEAEASYRRALQIRPSDAEAHNNLGNIIAELGRLNEAEASYRQALKLKPNYAEAYVSLGNILIELQRPTEAETCYRRSLDIKPDHIEAQARLGYALFILGRLNEAEASLRLAIYLEGENNTFFTLFTLGNVLMAADQIDESHAMFRRAQHIQLLSYWPSKKKKADFSVLLLDSSDVLSTPLGYLLGNAGYDIHSLALLLETEYDIDVLRSNADVVINLISDADNGKDILPFVQDLVDRIGRPTVNHPRHIRSTDRATISGRLSGISLCRIPKTVLLSADMLARTDWHKCIEGFTMPLLIRCAGTHGGNDFEKIDDIGAIDPFVSHHPDANFYVSEFVDYCSDDGYFRKYRMVYVNDEILPYHLAIHDHWLVHHFRTNMAGHEWMRNEEEAFLKEPHLVFSEEHYIALRKVALAIGLEYCGIDCSLDHDGNIVVFEANATMRIHDEKSSIFLYKNPHIAKIKVAFDSMLSRLVNRDTSS